MGEANIVYRLSKNGEEIIDETNNVSFFRSNAIISSQSITKVRNLTLVEIFQLLGGLQSMFFILERMNKHLYYFKEASN